MQLNVLHWHLTDTQSFPIQLEKFPQTTGQMAHYGAYGPDKIYTVAEVKDLVTYANKRGKDDFLGSFINHVHNRRGRESAK